MKTKILILFFSCLSIWAVFNTGQDRYMLNWDKSGYYIYLPAFFIEHDLRTLSFYPGLDSTYGPTYPYKWYAIYQDSVTGGRYTKYPIGLALMDMPLFLVAHAYTITTGSKILYGYSQPYQISACFSELLWFVVGLLYLRKFLRRYFSENIVFICIAIILFATNLYWYELFDKGMSHAYSFSLFCLMMYATDSWYRYFKKIHLIVIGLLMGLITVVRPTNAVICLVPLLWGINAPSELIKRISYYFKRIGLVMIALLCFVAVLTIQLSYWKYTTNHWLIYSYKGEYFDFLQPHITEGLFSYRKGWFIYTPVALLFSGSFILLWKYYRRFFWSLFLFFIVNIYVVFSWSQWYYGGGFGARALAESFAVLAFPFCCFLKNLEDWKPVFKWSVVVLIVFFVGLNIFQSYQFKRGIIHFDKMNRAYYWRVFGKLKINEEDKKLLND